MCWNDVWQMRLRCGSKCLVSMNRVKSIVSFRFVLTLRFFLKATTANAAAAAAASGANNAKAVSNKATTAKSSLLFLVLLRFCFYVLNRVSFQRQRK